VSGGRSPWQMLRVLAKEDVPWPGVHIVQVDERVAPAGDADRNLTHIGESLLANAPLGVEQVHAMPVESANLDAKIDSRMFALEFAALLDGLSIQVALDDPDLQARVAELFMCVWSGAIENDALNRLVVAAGLTPRDVVILRALAKYLHQTGMVFTEPTLAAALVHNPVATRGVLDLFHARLDPSHLANSDAVDAALVHAIDEVVSLDDDRLLRALAALVRAVVRTVRAETMTLLPDFPIRAARWNEALDLDEAAELVRAGRSDEAATRLRGRLLQGSRA